MINVNLVAQIDTLLFTHTRTHTHARTHTHTHTHVCKEYSSTTNVYKINNYGIETPNVL